MLLDGRTPPKTSMAEAPQRSLEQKGGARREDSRRLAIPDRCGSTRRPGRIRAAAGCLGRERTRLNPAVTTPQTGRLPITKKRETRLSDKEGVWPFDEPPHTVAFTTKKIVDGVSWIAWVSHDSDDGAWQFHAAEGPSEDEATVVGLATMLSIDSTVRDVASLPLGWVASRVAPGSPWRMSPRT